jgi:hypothetical protein
MTLGVALQGQRHTFIEPTLEQRGVEAHRLAPPPRLRHGRDPSIHMAP